MTRASDNAFPSILITEGTEPSAPAAGKQRLYIDSTTHKLKRTDSSGTDVTIEGSSTTIVTDTIWDAKGDLAVGTGSDTASRLAVGSNGQVLTADSGESTGVKWAASSGGGGGRGEYASKYNPDHETPTTSVAVQNEFNGAIGSGWAWSSAPTTEDYSTYPGYGYFVTSTSELWLSKAWTPGATDLTVAAKFHISRPVTNSTDTPSLMLGVGDGTGNPSNAVLANIFPKQGASSTFEPYNKNTGTLAAIGGGAKALDVSISHTPLYMRVTRLNSGPTWRFYFSFNGLAWTEFASTGSKSMTVGAISLRLADQANVVAIDWIRAWTSIVEAVGG